MNSEINEIDLGASFSEFSKSQWQKFKSSSKSKKWFLMCKTLHETSQAGQKDTTRSVSQ